MGSGHSGTSRPSAGEVFARDRRRFVSPVRIRQLGTVFGALSSAPFLLRVLLMPTDLKHSAVSARSDPAEATHLRWFYRDWRPTRFGRLVNRASGWALGLGLVPIAAALEVRGRVSGARRVTPVVIARVGGERYLVSMLGEGSDWVKNVDASHGDAVLRRGRRRAVRLVRVPTPERAPVLREYVKTATSGRQHFPVRVDAPLSEFEAIAEHYPVFRIEPREG
jgi:deazaflavin-dependent oxidoreductase (nitroreductase family)